MAKKVLKYNEEQFITLLENIVKKVKQEERLNESRTRNFSDTRRDSRKNRS